MKDNLRKKVLAKMLTKSTITNEEYESGKVSEERIEMFTAGIQLLRPAENIEPKKTISEQLELRKIQLEVFENNEESIRDSYSESSRIEMIKYAKNQIKKLEKLQQKKRKREEPVQKRKTFCKTQQEEVERHLEEDGSITSFQAFTEYGITRLSAIIYNLRYDKNLRIKTESITKKNRYGNSVTFAKYILRDEGKNK